MLPPVSEGAPGRIIDTLHAGTDRVIGAWERGGVIIDPGPASTVPTLLEALGDVEPHAILLTHIHLDHAAGTGTLARHFPGLRVYVHEVGAPHIADPSRLWRSASRLYGEENMLELWGEVLPVAEERITVLGGGELVEGMEVLHTPGHASHHVTYLDTADGSAYVGDVAGVRVPPAGITIMPTPPPEIDVEAWLASIDAVCERAPERLRLTHFGEIGEAGAQLQTARETLERMASLARQGEARFMAAIGAEIDAQPPGEAERMRRAMPPEQVWQGLERYWRKRES